MEAGNAVPIPDAQLSSYRKSDFGQLQQSIGGKPQLCVLTNAGRSMSLHLG